MVIVFGASKAAIKYINNHKGEDEMVCYDNDRRKWGCDIAGIPIKSLDEYLEIVEKEKCKIIVTIRNKTALFFLKDTCSADNEVYYYNDGNIEEINLNGIDTYERALQEIQEDKIKKYKNVIVSGQIKSQYAKQHYLEYIKRREKNHNWPEITSVEITNHCNLKCPNCPTPTCKRAKGFMSKEVFNKTLEYVNPDMDSYFSLHGLGEPLLHPDFFEFVQRIIELEKPILISTNGVLLDKEKTHKLLDLFKTANKSKLFISFHTKKSVENWKYAVELMKEKGIDNVELYGQILEHNEEQAISWLQELGIKDPLNDSHIRYVTSHSFAGGVESRRTSYKEVEVSNRFRNCVYIKNNTTAVAWDGRLKVCCLDSELEGIGGTVFDIERLRHKNVPYKLCGFCDPDWTSGYQ